MATAPAVTASRFTLHNRGTWSAKEDRLPSAVWLAILWVGMIAGFGVDFPRYLHQHPPAPAVIHVHAVVFSVWMFLLTAQVLMVLGNRIAWHRRLGLFMVGWASLMAILGPWAALASRAEGLTFHHDSGAFLIVNFVEIIIFLALLAWGVWLRKNPAAHKRIMILSTVAIASPGFARFSAWLLSRWGVPTPAGHLPRILYFFCLAFYGNVLLVALMLGWDWARGRLMRQHVIASAALLGAWFGVSVLYFWPPWAAFTTRLLHAWIKFSS